MPEDSSGSHDPGVDGNEEDNTLSLPELVNGAQYLDINDDALCFSEDSHLEDDIIEAVVNERSYPDGNNDLDDNSDREQTAKQTVTHAAARRAVPKVLMPPMTFVLMK